METITVTVLELYNIRNFLGGQGVKGLINEPDLTEGLKRRANKVFKIVLNELEPINKQLDEIRAENSKEKEWELLSDKISISIEKLDFQVIENIKLADNYQLLYDTIFKNS